MSILSELALRKIASEYDDQERAYHERQNALRSEYAKTMLNLQRELGTNSIGDKLDKVMSRAVDGVTKPVRNAYNKGYNFMFNTYPNFVNDAAEDFDGKMDSIMRDMKSPIPLRYLWNPTSGSKALPNSEISRRTNAMEDSIKSRQK